MSGRDLDYIEFHGRANIDFDSMGFVVLSSILSCVALVAGSVPVLIGAMILAPAFDPLIAIAFALLNRNWELLRQALLSSLAMFGTSFVVCLITVWALSVTDAVPLVLVAAGEPMIAERLTVGYHSVVIALAAGAGGALASASDRQSNLVGVVVALALVPALAAAAIAFESGILPGWGGLALFAMNVAGIVIAGVLVLYLRSRTGRLQERVENR